MLVWWSVLFVNLAGLWDAQVVGETSLLGVPVRVFPEDVSVGFSDAYTTTPFPWAPLANPLGPK